MPSKKSISAHSTVPGVSLGTYPVDDRNRRGTLRCGPALGRLHHHLFHAGADAVVGSWEEFKADNEIEALKKNLALHSRVLRDGKWSDVEAKTLMSGDIVIVMVKLGNVIPADLKLIDGDYLRIDQAALTGESLPVDKKKNDVAYSGSIVRMGQMNGLVVATGMNTLFGRTARLVESVQTVSHFQKAVLKIGNFLILITLGLVALILTVALYRGDPLVETLLFALILTVAAIPVALPAVLSVTMAVGASALARMKAIVSGLVAIEEMRPAWTFSAQTRPARSPRPNSS
jgi:H+-transporting ATPase